MHSCRVLTCGAALLLAVTQGNKEYYDDSLRADSYSYGNDNQDYDYSYDASQNEEENEDNYDYSYSYSAAGAVMEEENEDYDYSYDYSNDNSYDYEYVQEYYQKYDNSDAEVALDDNDASTYLYSNDGNMDDADGDQLPRRPSRTATPVCYVYLPKGCPRQRANKWYPWLTLIGVPTNGWGRDNWGLHHAHTYLKYKCMARKKDFDSYCGVHNAVMLWRDRSPPIRTPPPPRPIATAQCYVFMPSGCPARQYDGWYPWLTKGGIPMKAWGRDNWGMYYRTVSEAMCRQREIDFNSWCAARDVRTILVPARGQCGGMKTGQMSKPCHGSGDPHVYTFDQSYYHPQGTYIGGQLQSGWYRYVYPCKGRFMPFYISYYLYRINNAVSGTRGIKVQIGDTTFKYKHGDANPSVNGQLIALSAVHVYFDDNGNQLSGGTAYCRGWMLRVYKEGAKIVVDVINDKVVRATGKYWTYGSWTVIDEKYKGKSCGLCGKYSDNPNDDFTLCNGELLATDRNILRHFNHGSAIGPTAEFVKSYDERHICGKEREPRDMKTERCSDAQKDAAKSVAQQQFRRQCTVCNDQTIDDVSNYRSKWIDGCADDILEMDGCNFDKSKPADLRGVKINVKECQRECRN